MLLIRCLLVSLLPFLIFYLPLDAASRQPVYGQKGLVVSTSSYASEIGAAILKQGGNAADASVAVGMVLAVTWPAAGNLGGGGFALLRTNKGEAHFIDYRETAPAAANEKFYQDAKGDVLPEVSSVGYRSVAVPGTPAGLELIHKRWGKVPWSKVIEPARRLAAEGYRLEESHIRILQANEELLRRFPETMKVFFPKGQLPRAGEKLIQKDLARTLKTIQKEGAKAFYQGSIARLLVDDISKQGGVISRKDLEKYKVEVREALKGRYGNYEVLTAPPPSSGGVVLLEMFGMLEKDDLKSLSWGSAAYLHLLAETMKRAFADRSEWLGDPAFVDNPIKQLLEPSYLAMRRGSISPKKATPSLELKPAVIEAGEKPDTTHFTVIDAEGMIITNTYTLNGSFGSGAIAKGTGILLNNEMDDFTAKAGLPNMYGLIQNARNSIAPGKRPLSSMSPTILLKAGKPLLALGSPGGPTIINTVFQVVLNVLVHGMNIQQAVDAPRIHHQWMPDEIVYEPWGINPDTRHLLEAMQHTLTAKPRMMGDAQAIYFDEERQQWSGASDSRWGGVVAAP